MSELKRLASRSKKDYLEIKMLAEEEVILLRQQLVALRKALAQSEQLCKETKKTLEKEVRSQLGQVRKLPVTWGKAVFFTPVTLVSTTYNWLVMT